MPRDYMHVGLMFVRVCGSMFVLCLCKHTHTVCALCVVYVHMCHGYCAFCVHCIGCVTRMYTDVFNCAFFHMEVSVNVLCMWQFRIFFSCMLMKWKRKCFIICGEYSLKLNRLKTTFPSLSENMLKGFQKGKEISRATISILALLVSE